MYALWRREPTALSPSFAFFSFPDIWHVVEEELALTFGIPGGWGTQYWVRIRDLSRSRFTPSLGHWDPLSEILHMAGMPASSAYLFICCHFPGADLFCSHGIFLCLSFACCTYLLVLPYKIPQAGGLDNKCVPCSSEGWESESRMLAGWPLWLAGGMFSCVCLWSFLSSCAHVFSLNFLFLPVELGPTYTKLYNLICFFKVLEIVTFWGTQEEDFLVSTHSPSHHSGVAGAYRCLPVWGSGCWAYKRMAFMLPSQEVGTRLVWGTIQLSGSYMLLSLSLGLWFESQQVMLSTWLCCHKRKDPIYTENMACLSSASILYS